MADMGLKNEGSTETRLTRGLTACGFVHDVVAEDVDRAAGRAGAGCSGSG